MPVKIKSGESILFIGNSITDAGRRAAERPLGAGYVKKFADLLTIREPGKKVHVINKGIGGDVVTGLRNRWQDDVLRHKPDWLSVMIGINDVWRQFDAPNDPLLGVPFDEYRENLDRLITTAKPVVGKGLILMTPYFIEPNRDEPMRAMMDRYGEAVKELAAEHGARLVDTQAAFDEALKTMHPLHFCADRVHPNPLGHYLLARAFLRVIEAV